MPFGLVEGSQHGSLLGEAKQGICMPETAPSVGRSTDRFTRIVPEQHDERKRTVPAGLSQPVWVGDHQRSTTTFRVTANGQVYINGTVTMSAGSSINWANVTEQNVTQSEAYNKANSAEQIANSAQSIANGASSTANSAWNKAEDAESTANQVSSEFRDVKLTVGEHYVYQWLYDLLKINLCRRDPSWGRFENLF